MSAQGNYISDKMVFAVSRRREVITLVSKVLRCSSEAMTLKLAKTLPEQTLPLVSSFTFDKFTAWILNALAQVAILDF